MFESFPHTTHVEIPVEAANTVQIALMEKMSHGALDEAFMTQWIERYGKSFREYCSTNVSLAEKIIQGNLTEQDYDELINALDKDSVQH